MAAFELQFSLSQGAFSLELDVRVDAKAVALFGPSGSGKTSIIEAIAGLRTPTRGRIAIGGRVLFDDEAGIDAPSRLRRVGYVPQEVLLFPHLDVRANVLYGRRAGDRPPLSELIELLDLGTLMDRRVVGLSGGERQRVALARAMYSGPDVLLLDEPLAAIDLPRRRRITDALLRIRDELDVPLVYVTHTPEEAEQIADYALSLEAGRVVASGTPVEALQYR